VKRYKIDFKSMPWEDNPAGFRFKVHREGDMQLRLVEYFRTLEPHWCSKGHMGCILEGRMEIKFDQGSERFGPGDGVFIPCGEEHRHEAKVLTDSVKVVFVEQV
jgi:quercetin dioxygenase-like cupin family protein